ncbi:hypothetical protein [Streptosporangium sp. NPDC000396]|uniref:hypothetical protein n=1 Tax=Streptosporangium sp. NPDC000396 TaxID=3366185 RepID=UPI0036740EF0
MRRKIALAVAAPGLAVVLTGCGVLPGQLQGGGGQERQSQQVARQADSAPSSDKSSNKTETEPGPETEAGPEPGPGTGPDASAPPQQGKVIATRDVKAGGADLTVDITGLRRQGRLITLSWTVTNKGDTAWDMSSNMGDTPAGIGLTVGGVSLVDPVNAKRYRVARTGEGLSRVRCVCSEYDVRTEPGEVLPLYATYAAPPPDVRRINVEMPVLGVFTDVPIS